MPSHDETIAEWDKYTATPILVFQIQTYIRLNAIESMVFNHIILNSLNIFVKRKSSSARQWVDLSPSEFGTERGYTRQAVQEAIRTLISYDLIHHKDVTVQTNSGQQKGRQYCLISNKKLLEKFELLQAAAKPQGAKSHLAPVNSINAIGAKRDLAPQQARLGTLTGPTWHLDRPYLAPWCANDLKSLEKITRKDSLKTFKEFINTFSDFQNSFFELYSSEVKSHSAVFKIEMKIHALLRRYGAFSTMVAMYACLFSKDAQTGNFEALEAFLEENKEKLKIQEESFTAQSDKLFMKLMELYQKNLFDNSIELKIFRENFRQNARVLLMNVEFERSSNEIFLYNGFLEDVLYIWDTCNGNIQFFTSEVLKKLNLYFQSKILGIKGLNFVQSHNL